MNTIDTRDMKIDILRAIAILCIILAHSNPVGILFQIRNFDVTLMVFLIGASFYISNNNKEISYIKYIKNRFKRLIIPTWLFLSVFFILFYFVSLIIKNEYYFDLEDILLSYSLISGIGFVWIMGVFFIVSILNPLILKLSKRIKSNLNYFIILVVFSFFWYCLFIINSLLSERIQILFEAFILQGIGYGLVAAIGIRLKKINKKEMLILLTVFLLLFVGLAIKNDFIQTQQFKYPPTMYYLSYGLFVSLLLYILLDIKLFINALSNKVVFYISKFSLWLYFWHIIPVYIIIFFGESLPVINENFITRFIFILFFALLLTDAHEKIKKLVTKSRKKTSQSGKD